MIMRIFMLNLFGALADVCKFWGLILLVLLLLYAFIDGISRFDAPEYPHSGFVPDAPISERGAE